MRFTKPITAVAGLAAVFTAGCLPAESVPVAVLTASPLIVEVPIEGFSMRSIVGQNETFITNNGGENSGLLTVEITGPFRPDFEDCDGESLEPGAECQIEILYDGFNPNEVSAASTDPTTIRDVGYLTVSGANTPAPVVVKLIATQDEVQEF
jgi:hypothetical protein